MEADHTDELGDATTQGSGKAPESVSPPSDIRMTRRYQVLLPFGEGAMGQVFLAKDRYLLRKVALKKLLPHIAQNPVAVGRFLREAQITAQLDHPSVVPVYTLEETWDHTPAYAMKLVRGDTLKEQLQRVQAEPNPAQLRPLLEQFLKVCDTLAYAHSKGVIHRDLKPANLMSGDFGAVYVMDWGIARKMGDLDEAPGGDTVELSYPEAVSQDETQAGHILGTPRYMSPEQAAGRNDTLDGRSDQLALGLILYEIVTLRQAYQAPNMGALLKTVLKAEKQPLLSPYPKQPIPPELTAIIHKATARKAAERYADVGTMAQDIRRYLRGEAVLAKPDTPYQALVRWIGKHQGWTLFLLFVLLIGGAIGLGLNLERNRHEMETAQAQSQKLGAFLQAVAEQTQTINRQFARYEHILQRLSASSTLLLQQGRPHTEEIYTDHGVLQGKVPPDFIYAYHYHSWLSPLWPVWYGPASAQQALLAGLRPLLPQLLLDSSEMPPAQLTTALQNQGLPISWLFVALEQGSIMTYPGKAGLAATYQLQQQPWYQQARQATGIHWGQPYADSRGQGLMLAATQRLENHRGELLGVAGLEVSFQYLVDALLTLPHVPEVVESYLIDAQGRMQVRSSARSRMQGLRFGEQAGSSAVLELPLFPQAGVVQAMRKQPSGYRRYQAEGRQMLAAWYQLPALQGYYLVTLDAGRYFSATGAAGAPPSPIPSGG